TLGVGHGAVAPGAAAAKNARRLAAFLEVGGEAHRDACHRLILRVLDGGGQGDGALLAATQRDVDIGLTERDFVALHHFDVGDDDVAALDLNGDELPGGVIALNPDGFAHVPVALFVPFRLDAGVHRPRQVGVE